MTTHTDQKSPEFFIQRIYIKDLSFESPKAPHAFTLKVQPTVNLNIQADHALIEPDHYEVTLTATITAQIENDTFFLIEIKQAGIFLIRHLPAENMPFVLGVTVPTILFPYLREAVSETVARGGFQHFYLTPINFEAVFLANTQPAETTTLQ